MAGLSVAAVVVPQGMSYAALAGLPSVFGLYGAFVPVWLYAATGSSKHLVGGEPTALLHILPLVNISSSQNPRRWALWR